MKLNHGHLGVELGELLQTVERAVRPGSERRTNLRLQRVVLHEERRRGVRVAPLVQRSPAGQIPGLGIHAEAERQRQRRSALPRRGSRRRRRSPGRISV